MQKLFALLKAPQGADRVAYMQWVLETAPSLTVDMPELAELIVNLVDVDPGDAQWVRPGEAAADVTLPDFDAVVEIAGAEPLLFEATSRLEEKFKAQSGLLWIYRASAMPARVNRLQSNGSPSPGVKYIVFCRFHADLPSSAVKRSWAHHVPLALRVHVGADIYIRHWIEEALSPGAPFIQGITELHFPTWEDMRDRWFIDEDGRQQIIQDIGHFLAFGIRLYTSEHVVRAADPA